MVCDNAFGYVNVSFFIYLKTETVQTLSEHRTNNDTECSSRLSPTESSGSQRNINPDP